MTTKNYTYCKVCKCEVIARNYNIHLTTKKHNLNLEKSKIEKQNNILTKIIKPKKLNMTKIGKLPKEQQIKILTKNYNEMLENISNSMMIFSNMMKESMILRVELEETTPKKLLEYVFFNDCKSQDGEVEYYNKRKCK